MVTLQTMCAPGSSNTKMSADNERGSSVFRNPTLSKEAVLKFNSGKLQQNHRKSTPKTASGIKE